MSVIVIGIAMQVATWQTYAAPPVEVAAPLAERYFLIQPATVADTAFRMTRTQGALLLIGLAAITIVGSARLVEAEAGTRRIGLFLYLFVGLMLAALFVAILLSPSGALFGGGQ